MRAHFARQLQFYKDRAILARAGKRKKAFDLVLPDMAVLPDWPYLVYIYMCVPYVYAGDYTEDFMDLT